MKALIGIEPSISRLCVLITARDQVAALRQLGLQSAVPSAATSRNRGFPLGSRPRPQAHFNRYRGNGGGLAGRRKLDISLEAAEAAGELLWESKSVAGSDFVRASTILLPVALGERSEVASPLIAAAFPPVYRELAKEGAFDFLNEVFVV